MNRVVWLLNQPYPLETAPALHLRKAALIGLFVALFLLVFQPFGIDGWVTLHKPVKIIGFGVVSFAVTVFNALFWQWLFLNQFTEERWTVGREVLFTTANVLLIAAANWFYLDQLIDQERSGVDWLTALVITFVVAIFPVTGIVLFKYITQLRKYSRAAADLSTHPLPAPKPTGPVSGAESPGGLLTLVADNDKDSLTLPPNELLFIESSDNYSTVVYRKAGQIARPLLRSSLSRLESQIDAAHIVRCHRSYIVNLDRVERVTGNAQGYKLILTDGQMPIPVARRYNDTVVAKLKEM